MTGVADNDKGSFSFVGRFCHSPGGGIALDGHPSGDNIAWLKAKGLAGFVDTLAVECTTLVVNVPDDLATEFAVRVGGEKKPLESQGSIVGSGRRSRQFDIEGEPPDPTRDGKGTNNVRAVDRGGVPGVGSQMGDLRKDFVGTTLATFDRHDFVKVAVEPFASHTLVITFGQRDEGDF